MNWYPVLADVISPGRYFVLQAKEHALPILLVLLLVIVVAALVRRRRK
jgi:uncharacterized protein (TIGR03382 family)